MIHEQVYICWHKGQTEGDGKEIKASSLRQAAKKAVDIWRHENVKEIAGQKVTVYLKDEGLHVHEVVVSGDPDHDQRAPEAFM